MITNEQIIEVLESIQDPELMIDIYTLGLIYEIEVKSDTEVYIQLTYTTPMCPFGPIINKKITDGLRELGVSHVDIELVFDPPWQPSDELRESLGL